MVQANTLQIKCHESDLMQQLSGAWLVDWEMEEKRDSTEIFEIEFTGFGDCGLGGWLSVCCQLMRSECEHKSSERDHVQASNGNLKALVRLMHGWRIRTML